ncbi:MAG: crotonase/enoyl-CoA hydratase family protein, partial [Shimia sp.]|nr:crotonase/enoyl-CoA hydratase family protein [Shimia sp.]
MISYSLEDGITILGIDDGKRNAVGPAFVAAMNHCLDRADVDKAKAIVLEGRTGTFSAGFDLKEFQKGPEAAFSLVCSGFEMLLRLFEFPRPIVTVCSGHGIGMGAFLLMVSDFRICAAGEFKFSLPESRLGMNLGPFLIALAQSRITPGYMTRVAILSEELDPDMACKAGILDEVVPQEEVRARALE